MRKATAQGWREVNTRENAASQISNMQTLRTKSSAESFFGDHGDTNEKGMFLVPDNHFKPQS